MAHEIRSINAMSHPELLRLAEEVIRSGEAAVLRKDDNDLAFIVPASRRAYILSLRKTKTKEDLEAFRAAGGGWKDVDTDKLLADIYEGRRSSRPPVDL